MSFQTISVIGLGYIGLPTAAIFASRKIRVIGVDVSKSTIDTINQGEIHIVEPELDIIVSEAVSEGYLKATNISETADAYIIAVPTPFKNNGAKIPEPDLSYIKSAASQIAPVLKKGDLVVLESTSPVGTTETLAEWLFEARSDLSFPQHNSVNPDINVAYCPERVLPGRILQELVENDRVIGGMTPRCSHRAVELYNIFVKGECVITDNRTAEMTKLTENACRDVEIAFANELSVICNKLDINVWDLISLANRHPRINILQPGPGVGGHCIAVDPWFIISKNPEESRLMHSARTVNDSKPGWVVNRVEELKNNLFLSNPERKINGIKIACYGLSFKADIDDLRGSPAMKIARDVASLEYVNVMAVEPNITKLKNENFELVSIENAIKSADISILLVDHSEFKAMDKLPNNFIIDTKGIWTN